jgi:hypothetical protein
MQVTWVRGGRTRDEVFDFDDIDDLADVMDAEFGFEDEDTFLDAATEGSDETVYVYLDEDKLIQWTLSRGTAAKRLQQFGEEDENDEEDEDFTG